ncbi:transposase, partial [Streptomyces sp. NPDC002573]|uniref:IS110 family transposase n=1 Tax=Streptomyces sp. NPDC002573 TaxID=3364651 RepID=UPI0036B15DA8
DSIDDADVLRHGATAKAFTGMRAPTTLGAFLHAFTWGHVRQLQSAVRAFTCNLAVHCRLLPGPLQPHLNLMLVNPSHLKGIRGRKTDPSDAAFLARAGASGMVMGSFVPPRTIRELRDLTRRRTEVVRAAGAEAQRLEKELEDTGFKLTSVLSNVVGVSGRAGPGRRRARPGAAG